MPSRRELIKMTPDEINDYLASHSRIIIVTNGPEGMPHPVPMQYGVDPESRIIITSFRKSQKIRNLERDPRAALLVESGETYNELQSVIAYANAEIVDDPEEVMKSLGYIKPNRNLSGSLSDAMREQVGQSMSKRVVVRFSVYKYVSWDHGKLIDRY